MLAAINFLSIVALMVGFWLRGRVIEGLRVELADKQEKLAGALGTIERLEADWYRERKAAEVACHLWHDKIENLIREGQEELAARGQ